MKETTKNWLPYIKADLTAADALINSSGKNRWTNTLALWHCQQAIEKTFKAIMIEQGKEILKIHDLARLKELSGIDLEDDDLKFILTLNNYYLKSRYPDMIYSLLTNPDNKATIKIFKQTIKLHTWLIKKLKNL